MEYKIIIFSKEWKKIASKTNEKIVTNTYHVLVEIRKLTLLQCDNIENTYPNQHPGTHCYTTYINEIF